MINRTVIVAVALSLLAGCASAKKSYSRGADAAAEGRWAAACEQYIDALRRDPEYPGARDGAYDTGTRAVVDYLDVASRFETADRYEQAVQEYRKIDRLVGMAASVSVVLDLPADYIRRKTATMNRAVDDAMAVGDRYVDEGHWREAYDVYRDVPRRFALSAEQVERVREAQIGVLIMGARLELENGRYDRAADVASSALDVYGPDAPQSAPAHDLLDTITKQQFDDLLASARALMNQGRYQEADRCAGRAIAIYGADAPASAAALALRDDIVAQGTVVLVATPAQSRDDLASRVPADLLVDLNNRLEHGYWADPPLFIATADASDVRGELNRLDYARQAMTAQRAIAVAQNLTGDYAATFTIVRCEAGARGEGQTREVVHQNGESVHVTVYSRRSLQVRCAYRVIDAANGNVVDEGTVEASASRACDSAVYDGNLDNLLLTREQYRWFDERAIGEVDLNIEREVAASLAEQLSTAVFGSVLDVLP